jgi:hypothetical protein
MRTFLKFVVMLALLLIAPLSASAADYPYTETNLGAMFSATGLNEKGDVVGSIYQGDGSTFHSVFYSYSAGALNDL